MTETNRPYCDIVYGRASSSPHVGFPPGTKKAFMMKTNDKCPLTVSKKDCGPTDYASVRQAKWGMALRWE